MDILISGFGGQGILFAGKFLVNLGMIAGREVTWLPSYGPEMRGGTANCGVIISEKPIGSPIVTNPDILVCMNLPSLIKFEKDVKKGGDIFIDSSLVDKKAERTDVTVYGVPATKIADENGMRPLANMIMTGALLSARGLFERENILQAMKKTVPERKKEMFDMNMRAIELGAGYEG